MKDSEREFVDLRCLLTVCLNCRDIFEKTSLNSVPRPLRLMDIENLDKTWLVRFSTCGGASKSNQLNTNSNVVYAAKHFNLASNTIIQAMAICEQMLEDLCLGTKIVTVYCSQWQYLVNSLSTKTVEQFTHYHSIMARLRGLVPNEGDKDLEAGMKVLTFCIQSLVELAQSLEHGLVLLSTCRRKEWWRTVLRMPNVALDLKKRRRNSFCVVLQQCEWSLDLVKLAFDIVQEHFAPSHAIKLKTVSFKWSNEKQRLLFIDGHDTHGEGQRDETNKESLVEVEKKDSTELIASLDNMLHKFKSNWWPRVAKVKEQEQKIISFLKMKLEGPTPYPTYASYSTQIHHQDLIYKKVVGHGSFGVVLKMEWMGEEVAVKQMKNIHRKDFEAEAAILATVQHPNIVHLIGCSFVEKDATGMLVMELMEQDLRTLIDCRKGSEKMGPFPVIVAIDIMLQVAEAMQHLRECRVLHRDLKAANILVSRQNPCETPVLRKKEAIYEEVKQWMLRGKEDHFVVKLADFGLAKYQAQTSRFMTKMAGTGPWRAPEVFKADIISTEYKWPADVYSFGVTCFEILTGDMPFEGVWQGQLYEKIKSGDRPTIDSRFPTCVTQLIKRCWATEPLDRPDFSQICKDLWLCKLEQFGLEVCAD